VSEELELEDPKDLRAEIGKCPNSTNERKNMSTKTIYKRIALVAVAALGAGVLSVAPANATATAGTSGVILVSGSICAATSLTGTAPLEADGGADASPFESGAASGKLLIVPVGASLKVEYDAADVITLSGPLSVAQVGRQADATLPAVVSSTNGKIVITGNAADSDVTLSALSVGTATITVDTTAADPTVTASNTIRISIVAACASTAFAAATSFVSVEDTSAQAGDNVDASAAQADTEKGFLSIVANNAYGAAVPSGTWIVTATNGAVVGVASGNAATVGLTSTAAVTASGADIRVAVGQATEGVAQTSVVTVSYNGAVVATRTFTWTGDLASITVSSVRIGKTGAQNHNSFTVRTFDAAGNQISWPDASLTITGTNANVTAADAVATATAAAETSATNDGNFFTCGAGAKATTPLTVRGVNSALGVILSAPFNATCASTPATWTVSMDKASYVPGDIAVVTITAKDVNGNTVHDAVSNNGADNTNEVASYVYGAAGTAPVVTGSNLTAVVAPAVDDTFAAGVKTYSFIVGSTEGSYQLAVQLAGITTDTAKTAAYKIALSTATTSNADVLKAIVSLIASINKQIAALQKALLRR
jgi:trimeric autotransporter adhesin